MTLLELILKQLKLSMTCLYVIHFLSFQEPFNVPENGVVVLVSTTSSKPELLDGRFYM
jgi:hypothetical protein